MNLDDVTDWSWIKSSVLDETMIGVVIGETNGNLRYANKIFANMVGYSHPEEVIGKNIHDLLGEPQRTKGGESIIIAEGKWQDHFTLPIENNKERVLFLSGHLIMDEKNNPIAISGCFTDVTEAVEIKNKHQVFFESIKQSPSIFVLADTDGRIEYVNPAFTAVTGYSLEEVIGENPRIIHSGQTPKETYVELWESIVKGGSWKGELLNRKKDGNRYWEKALITAIKNEDGKIIKYAKLSEDITQLKEMETIKNKVASIFKHDVRSPISGILSIPQLLLEDENLTDQQKEYLRLIETTGYDLLEMINNSLTLERIESGELILFKEEVDLRKLVHRITHEKNVSLKEKSIEIKILINNNDDKEGTSFVLQGEERLYYAIFSNLINNAIEASSKNAVVIVNMNELENEYEFGISNTGVVPEHIRDVFFEKYVTANKSRGTGLGTYSARIMTEAMGGTIQMKTSEEEGTYVWITMPKL